MQPNFMKVGQEVVVLLKQEQGRYQLQPPGIQEFKMKEKH